MDQSHLSPLFQLSSDLIFTCTSDGHILHANPSWQRLLDLGPTRVFGHDLFSFVTLESAPLVRELLANAFNKNSTARIEVEFLDSKGLPVPFSLTGEAEGSSFVGIARPVSSHEINRVDRDHALGWKLAVEGSSAGLWDWNVETDEIYFSPRWHSMLGYQPSDLRESSDAWNDILHPDDLERAQRAVQDFLAGRIDTYKQEVRLRAKTGEYRWILTQGASLRDGNGRILRMAGWHLDIHEQKTAQERLQESKDKIRAILEAAPDLLLVIGSDYTYHEVFTNNPSSLIRPELERKGRKVSDIMPPAENARVEKVIDQVLATGQTASIDLKLDLPSGTTYLEARIAKGSDDEVVVISRNVTERVLTDMRLSMSETRFRHLVMSVPGVIYQFKLAPNGAMSFPFVSPKLAEVLGSIDELAPDKIEHPLIHTHPDDKPGLVQQIHLSAQNLSPFNWEGRILTATGQTKWLKAISTPRKEDDGSIIWDGIFLDVTAERVLRQTQRRLLAVIEASKDFIAISSPEGQTIFLNPSLRSLLGLAPDEPLGSDGGARLYAPWSLRKIQEVGIPTALRDGVWIGESAFVNSEGIEIPISQMIVAIRDEKGDLEYLAGVSRDISAMKAAESLLLNRQAQIASASKLAALGEMASGIAHEINNPLAIIHAYAGRLNEMASRGDVTVQEIRRTAEKIEATVLRISRIISGLRTISRSDQCEDFAPTKISLLLDNALALCSEKLRHQGIKLSIESEVECSTEVECSSVQICQVLLNLIINSQHAIEDQADKWIRVAVRNFADRVEISVADSGPGIPPDKRERIFEPFFTTKQAGVGTGLGLSISSAIMKNHGGALYLEPDSQHTCFTLVLPKGRASAQANVA